MKSLRITAVVLFLVAYAIAFYVAPLPSTSKDAEHPLLRIELLTQLLLRPDVYVTPNWFGSPPTFTLCDRLPILGIAMGVLLWAAVIGWLLMVFCRADRGLNRWEVTIFATAIGLNALSTWTLLMGLLGHLTRGWTIAIPMLLTLLLAAGIRYCKKSYRQEKPPHCNEVACDSDPISPHWLWLALPFVLMIVLASMVPPLDFDVREYHLQAPKEFFLQGRVTFLPHNVYADMALGTEMLNLLTMIAAGDWWLGALAGKTVIAAFTLLTALGLWTAGRRFFSPAVGVVAALVYLSVPWVVSIASGGFVEGASACYLFLAVYALLLSRKPHETTDEKHPMAMLALAGYLAGGAVATKYPAVLFVLAPLALSITWTRRSVKSLAKALCVFLLAATVACGLWFGKNWAETGNPTYPLLYEAFGGKTWNAEKECQWNRVHRPHDFSPKTLQKDIGRVLLTSEWISPLIVPLAVLAFFGRRKNANLCWILFAYFGFVIAVWWLFTHRIDRFWIPALPILALLAGVGAGWSSKLWWRLTFTGLLLVGLLANFVTAAADQGNAWFVGLERLRNDDAWIDPWHKYFNAHCTEGQLLMVGDAAVFDLKPPVLYNTCFDDCIFEQCVRNKTPEQIRQELSRRQITYVYIDWGEIARYRATYGFTEFVQPAVVEQLVAQGILEPLPTIEDQPGRGYRVQGGYRVRGRY
jgi:hypothetical protein